MTAPTLNSVAQRLYDGLIPFNDSQERDGESTAWALAYLCSFIGDELLQQIFDYAEDTDTDPGWTVLYDLERVPDEAIKYLGQLIGVVVDDALTPTLQKAQIADRRSQRRGTLTELQAVLTESTTAFGDDGWFLRERHDPTNPLVDSAYHFQVVIKTTNLTPDPDDVYDAMVRAKPAGLVMHYSRVTANDWQYIKDTYALWSDVDAALTTWAEALG
jgi:REP element-mobilizing transposase RayT